MLRAYIDTRGWDRLRQQMFDALRTAVTRVYNPVHYVFHLEYGHSRQAPHGMVRRSLPEIRVGFQRQLSSINFGAAARAGSLQQEVNAAVDLWGDWARKLIRSRTPIDTGNARLHWIQIRTDGTEVTPEPLSGDELAMAAKQQAGYRKYRLV